MKTQNILFGERLSAAKELGDEVLLQRIEQVDITFTVSKDCPFSKGRYH